ncbi:pentatricopeptide repeat-containing protein At2g30780-like [Trifolium pratense]|uniref:pentatricopeptide repeat-containing protein At2g30780-like n=1 Tax=Trifolium pratense TaxID=57577 RepID=UPI001E690E34|nr:pentatricopeptide repeat-containing protein At2g30780-like [Trifolium pratense]
MASGIRVLSIARKSYRAILPHNFFFFFRQQHSNSTSSSNPLLLKLLQLPNSYIKTTLDHEFPSLPTSLLSFDFLITTLSPSSLKPNLVLEWILERLLKENVKDRSLFSELIFLCGKLKNVQLGMRVFTSMETVGVKPTSEVFNSLISACLSSHDIVTAYSLFEIMENSESYKPDFHTYNNFISAFSKSGNVDDMLAWYSAKKAAGLGLDLQFFESIISGSVNSKNFEIADRVFQEMVISEIIPNVTILESMLKRHCSQKSLCRANEFFKIVLDNGWQISETMAEMLVTLYHEEGQMEKMEELLETITKYPIDSGVLSRIHCGIVKIYAVLDRLDEVELSVGRMLKQGVSFRSSDDVEKVICSYFRSEAYDRLDIFLECIKNCYVLTRSTYVLLISGYRRANLHEKVDSLLVDMKSVGLT